MQLNFLKKIFLMIMNYPISVINDLLHIFQLVNVAATAELYLLNIVTVTV